jgi:hypothetical protein
MRASALAQQRRNAHVEAPTPQSPSGDAVLVRRGGGLNVAGSDSAQCAAPRDTLMRRMSSGFKGSGESS